MSSTLLLLPADAAADPIAVRVDGQGLVVAQHTPSALHERSAHTLLVVPGSAVHLRWMTLPGRSVAQSVAAARLQLAEHLATDAQAVHVAIAEQAEPDGTRLVAAVDAAVMHQWLQRAASVGVVPDAVVPDCLLLDSADADQALTVVEWDGRWLLRGPRLACSLEPSLAQLLLAAQPRAATLPPGADPHRAIAQFARHAATAPLDLRQHAFAIRPQARSGFSLRMLAALLALLVVSPLLLLLAQTLRYEIGARVLQARAAAQLGVRDAAAVPAALQARRQAGTAADRLAVQLGALFAAVDTLPAAELDQLDYRATQPLRATLLHTDATDLQQLSARLAEAGWHVDPGGSQVDDDRMRTPFALEPLR
ncbi:general secretion pathway protein L [Xanthomonas arboricola]|uniref:Type II secretion system protein L n=1 Tax=Xanthomonas cannabis pv. phaseoli TaxID=1885902 RepID=A0AB34P5E6_9XANT|nr:MULTISPECIES: type II secretion system protein GspL [Xanthomonas]KGK56398.1 type II secretion system protein L [Xanthomonas cannabis pv. phaseoli]MBB3802879.1 general secretion pathway protein L [Xanthomonas cannabis]MBB3804140.1 general secretion pathway protein L [Xanthomonas cannabis]PPU37586.1 type II secretion system protein GspL [Xanthomonas sp. CFBP 7912]RJS04008.1 type II secretion system protein GspL [Xanthomonas sp. CFBP 7698]